MDRNADTHRNLGAVDVIRTVGIVTVRRQRHIQRNIVGMYGGDHLACRLVKHVLDIRLARNCRDRAEIEALCRLDNRVADGNLVRIFGINASELQRIQYGVIRLFRRIHAEGAGEHECTERDHARDDDGDQYVNQVDAEFAVLFLFHGYPSVYSIVMSAQVSLTVARFCLRLAASIRRAAEQSPKTIQKRKNTR